MSETVAHLGLVKQLASWIIANLLGNDSGYIYIDSPDSSAQKKPTKVGGFVPDVLVPIGPGSIFVIGEAKTAQDLERKHSLQQLEAFLKECSRYENAFFVLAVPWDIVRFSRSMMREMQKSCGAEKVRVEVLEKLR